MDATLTIALIGASISVIGWIANYILSASAERRRQSLISQIEFTKQQLEELYGPLVFLVIEGHHSFSEAMQTLSSFFSKTVDYPESTDFIRDRVVLNENETLDKDESDIEEDSLARVEIGGSIKNSTLIFHDEDENDIWKYWIENEFFPRNEKIKSLLASKTHLIENDKIPNSWVEFIEHYNSWRIHFERWQKGKAKYPQYSKTGWPKNFDNDVISTFEKLKRRQSYLMGLVAGNEKENVSRNRS